MDDERIRQLTEEVLGKIHEPGPSELEGRVATLEAQVRELRAAGGAAPPAAVATTIVEVHRHPAHPALRVFDVGSGPDRCVMEPDKPCVSSGMCRALGH